MSAKHQIRHFATGEPLPPGSTVNVVEPGGRRQAFVDADGWVRAHPDARFDGHIGWVTLTDDVGDPDPEPELVAGPDEIHPAVALIPEEERAPQHRTQPAGA